MPAAYIAQSPVSSVKIFSLQMEFRILDNEVDFILVLAGEIRYELDKKVSFLNQNDVVMVNSNEFPVLKGTGNNLIMVISLKKDFFHVNGITSTTHFVCNSECDNEHDYSGLRKILSKIAIAHFEHSKVGDIHQSELCYSLLHYLVSFHQMEKNPSGGIHVTYNERKELILDYLNQNYMNPVSLTELAELTHLNSSYLSRFFRQAAGETLNSYIQKIRLAHAVRDLSIPEKTITAIAYENGFSTPASFCKIFTSAYGCSPSKYRKKSDREIPAGSQVENKAIKAVDYRVVEKELQNLALVKPERESSYNISYPSSKQFNVDNVTLSTEIKPVWNRLLNLGFCMNLPHIEFQKQLKTVQTEIGFEYGRVEGLLNEDVLLPQQSGGYNFAEFDRIINVLLDCKFKPFIDLSIRGSNVLLPGRDEVLYRHNDTKPLARLYLDKVDSLLKHCINMYGINEVNTWIFDLGIFHDEYLRLSETPKAYALRVKETMRLIRGYMLKTKIGGITYNAGMRPGTFESILKEISAAGFTPDFISTCIFPYEAVGNTNANLRLVSSDPERVKNEILSEKSILEKYPSLTQDIWLTAMGVSIQTQDYVNDTCFQSTFFVKNTLDLIGLVDAIGYYQLSDISEEYSDTSRILYGASGIMSRDGLKKPGFSAIKRLNNLNEQMLACEDCFFASTDGVNTYNLVLCNYSYFNELYCVSGAKGMVLENAYNSFVEPETQAVDIILNSLKNGKYKIVVTSLNREHGSLFDEWIKYGILDDLQPRDIGYLADVVHPQRLAHYTECQSGTLELHVQLLPHETKFIEIIRII